MLVLYDVRHRACDTQHIDDIWPCDEDSQCLLVIMWGLIVGDLRGRSILGPLLYNAAPALEMIIYTRNFIDGIIGHEDDSFYAQYCAKIVGPFFSDSISSACREAQLPYISLSWKPELRSKYNA